MNNDKCLLIVLVLLLIVLFWHNRDEIWAFCSGKEVVEEVTS